MEEPQEHDLDVDMSHLDINEKKRKSSGPLKHKLDSVQSPYSSPELDENSMQPRRSSRKKIRPLESDKRRVFSKPRKLVDDKNIREVHNYYLDKKVKRLPPSLETIFEEPKNNAIMSARKFKRTIQFSDNLGLSKDKQKVKKRVLKAKKICTVKRLNKKIAMDLLIQKLSTIDEDELENPIKVKD